MSTGCEDQGGSPFPVGNAEENYGSDHGRIQPSDTEVAASGSGFTGEALDIVDVWEREMKQLQLRRLLAEEKAAGEVQKLEIRSKRIQAKKELRRIQHRSQTG